MSDIPRLKEGEFLSVERARSFYGLVETGALFAEGLDRQLGEDGLAQIKMPVGDDQFQEFVKLFEACLSACPSYLPPSQQIDRRHGNEVGYTRKEIKIDPSTGLQTQDPKSIFHFNELISPIWLSDESPKPAEISQFLECGAEIQGQLASVAVGLFNELEGTHPNITRAYFPADEAGKRRTFSFMRIISYDGYKYDGTEADVAKPHTDIGGATIQAYADAPGFWASRDGVLGKRVFHDSDKGMAQFFMGQGHNKLYGPNSRFEALAHGVGRIISEGTVDVPARHAVILFIDAPYIDYGVTPADTLPHIFTKAS